MDSGAVVGLGLLAVFLITDVSPSRDCVKPYILGGLASLRGRGQRARFSCRRPYNNIFGTTHSTCIKGRWIPEPPKCGIDCPITHIKAVNHSRLYVSHSVCARSYKVLPFITGHCDDNLSTKAYPICIAASCAETYTYCNSNDCNVFAARNLNELYVSCEPGFFPLGPDTVICRLTGTSPFHGCKETHLQFLCDFENVSDPYCGWGQPKSEAKREGAFVWFRKQPSSDRREKMPDSDHTSQEKKRGGVFLYLPAEDLKMGDSVRLYSPTYNLSSNQSLSYCFMFWYHMKSKSVGELNVYINNEMKWTIAGEQGNLWNEGYVHLPNSNVSIIIEATRGYAADSYIAIDDFLITTSAEIGVHECFAEDYRDFETPMSRENFDSDDESQFETTWPSVDESTQAIDSVPTMISHQEVPMSSSQEPSVSANSIDSVPTMISHQEVPMSSSQEPSVSANSIDSVPTMISHQEVPMSSSQEPSLSTNSSEKAHSPSQEVFTSPNPASEISASASSSRETRIPANSFQEILATADPSPNISVSLASTPEVPISASSSEVNLIPTNSSQEVSVSPSPSQEVLNYSLEVPQQNLHSLNPSKQVYVTVEPSSDGPITSTVSLKNFSENSPHHNAVIHSATDKGYIPQESTEPPNPSIQPATYETPSSVNTVSITHSETSPSAHYFVKSLSTKTVGENENKPTKPLPDTVEGIHLNAHKAANATESAKQKFGDIHKNIENNEADMSARENSIAESDSVNDTHSQFDDALDPHFSDHRFSKHLHKIEESSTSSVHSSVKLFISKTPFEPTSDFKSVDDIENGIDQESEHVDHSHYDDYNSETGNWGEHVRSDHDLNDLSRQTPDTSGRDHINHEGMHQEIKTHEEENLQGLSGAPAVSDPYVKGTPTSGLKVSPELHYTIVALTGAALVLMIIVVISVFRVVRKRMKKQRQRAGMLDDNFSVNLNLSSSKEILNFSLLRADEL